jgi:outer membrane receptor protein involved in Fe transport
MLSSIERWMHWVTCLVTLQLIAVLCGTVAAQQVTVTGSILDPSGGTISGALVNLHSSHSTQSTKTGPDGEFSFPELPDNTGTVKVVAKGFAPVEQEWSANSGSVRLTFVLRGLAQSESILVSASRSELKLSEVPGSAVQLSQTDLQANPALTLDDVLRQVPGFYLFRRSSSRTANPTTQGVSLRGLGASGPSRALVLEDGVPIVDPFGGWVYWDRVPRAALTSLEVFRGGSSSLYGSDALGGIVQFLTRVPAAPAASVDISYGNENTPDVSAWAGTVFSRWDIAASADMSRTDGFLLVPASQRGTVDTPANSKHATVDTALGYKFSESGRAFVRGTFFDEARNNGTPLQTNSTGAGIGSAGINTPIGNHDWLMARIYGQAQGYDQTFSSISSNRNSEALTNIQHVPSQAVGGGVQWNHVLGSHTLIGGVDFQEVMGASNEQLFSSTTGAHFANNIAGGRQRSAGIFGQDIFRIKNKWTVIAGARWDDWNNFRGSTMRISLPSGSPTGKPFPDRSENSFSPRLSILRALNSNLSLSLSGYRAFRAPTLNELYRSFRQGNAVTNSNPQLRAERLTGAEAGLRAIALGGRLESRGTFFWSDIVDPVTNVTLSTTPTLIARQRQNLGRTRSLGVELDGAVHLNSSIEISAGYQYTHATVVDSPTLAGKMVPEVPSHQFTWEARYWNPARIMLSLEGRYSGAQFDDDVNTLLLNRYYVMNLFAGRRIRSGFVGYIAVENLLNQRYQVARVPPIVNLGPPILARAGIRYDFPAHK